MITSETLRSQAMELNIAMLSEPGGRRSNEDACDYCAVGDLSCYVLSDGAGGHGCGDVASNVVAHAVLERFREAPGASAELVMSLLYTANQAVVTEQSRVVEQANMRATAVVLILDLVNLTAIWGHVGDSRVYGFRNGAIFMQTRDHSVVQSMVDAGFLEPESVRTNPKRSVLTAAMGNAAECEPAVPSTPLALTGEEVFLLCSDGLWEYVDEAILERELGRAVGPESWLRALEAELLRHARPNHDNYSAIAVWLSSRDAILL